MVTGEVRVVKKMCTRERGMWWDGVGRGLTTTVTNLRNHNMHSSMSVGASCSIGTGQEALMYVTMHQQHMALVAVGCHMFEGCIITGSPTIEL
mmetsp:Transcript_25473/g.46041  ORF Transcript_25473/g.46041 Transcript_25473/m.46041 type:complete len:93 (+) Transcript_25473:99-377(+)